MKESRWFKFGLWLERFPTLHPIIYRWDGPAPTGMRYINRLNGHVVVMDGEEE